MKTKRTQMALFFSRGVSLETWVGKGLFDREKLLYESHLIGGHVDKVIWITYGPRDSLLAKDLVSKNRLHASIQVLGMPTFFDSRFGMILYSILSTIIHFRKLQRCAYFKSNQMDGAWAAAISKLVFGGRFCLRTGYTWSHFYFKGGGGMKYRASLTIEKWLYRYCDLGFVASKGDKEWITQKLGEEIGKKITVLGNYIDTTRFRPIRAASMRNKSAILYVGRLSEQKNIRNLILSLRGTGLLLKIIGDGEQKGELATFASKLQVEVDFMGLLPNSGLADKLNEHAFFVLPSFYEGMPKTLLEAMACGCVCIGTDVDGIKEVIEDGKSGLLAYGTDPASLSMAISRAIDADLDDIGRAARMLIESKYSLKMISEVEKSTFLAL